MNSLRRDARSFDIVLFALVVVLSAFGLLMIASITGAGSGTFINQLIFVVTGIAIMFVAAFINFETICKFYLPIYGVNILFLVVVLLLPADRGGVTRWIGIEIGGTDEVMGTMLGIQPSEFAKIFMVIFLAAVINKFRDQINKLWVVGIVVASTAIVVALIFAQPSLSASMVPLAIMVAMLFVGKLSWKYFVIATAVILPLGLFFFIELHAENPLILGEFFEPWQINRIMTFLYPEPGSALLYQNERALDALNSGLLTGRGLFSGTRVPEASNDFIFAIIGAELGFLGSLAVLAVIFVIVMRCFMIAHRSQLFLGKLLATGVGAAIAFQTFAHVGINAFILPNTGMNLPFVSSGGSSAWVFMAMIGLVINVGMTREYSMFESFS
ncbi:MAG: FtsW/RodA/SpoVE family cell cycle protein [Defluviitaleaceae bacterium]|nr:FtsW/RodA/SpoVE family cell cycle protein [Defluviitaleaceae bacterium]